MEDAAFSDCDMSLRIPFCESRGLLVVMESLPFGPPCDYSPVLPCSRHRAYQSEMQYDKVYSGYSGVRVFKVFAALRKMQSLPDFGFLASLSLYRTQNARSEARKQTQI